nr:MAG TPA_asm: hypothetical protein [Bacteriophage sp.]
MMVRRERIYQTIKNLSLFVEESYFSICLKRWTKHMQRCVIKMKSRLFSGIKFMRG